VSGPCRFRADSRPVWCDHGSVIARRTLDRAFWNLHARTWDDELARRERSDRIARLAPLLPSGGRVVDLGCGTGSYARDLAAAGFDVVGVDFAAAMLERARTDTEAEFVEADLDRELPFGDATFDGALCVYALQCVHDPHLFLAEAGRIVRPGGAFLAVVVAPGARPVRPRRARLGTYAFWLAKGAIARTNAVRRYTAAEARALLDAAGFAVVDERPATNGTELLARYEPNTAR